MLYIWKHGKKYKLGKLGNQPQNNSSCTKIKYCYNDSNIDLVAFVILAN